MTGRHQGYLTAIMFTDAMLGCVKSQRRAASTRDLRNKIKKRINFYPAPTILNNGPLSGLVFLRLEAWPRCLVGQLSQSSLHLDHTIILGHKCHFDYSQQWAVRAIVLGITGQTSKDEQQTDSSE
jgi:hypothetical protein